MRAALRQYALHLLAGLIETRDLRGDQPLTVPRDEVDALLSARWDTPARHLVPDGVPPAVCWDALEAEMVTQGDSSVSARRWLELMERWRLSPAEGQLLALLVAVGSDHDVLRGYRYAWADHRRQSMPLGVALAAIGQRDNPALLGGETPLYRYQLVLRHREHADVPTVEQGIRAHDDVVAWLLGHEIDRTDLRTHEQIPPPPPRLEETLARVRQRASTVSLDPPNRWLVHGPNGAGRIGVAAGLVESLAPGGIWILDVGQVVESGAGLQGLRLAVRGAVLTSSAVVVKGIERLPEPMRPRWAEAIERVWHGVDVPLIWIIEDEPPPWISVHPNGMMPVSYPSRAQRRDTWAALLSDSNLPDGEIDRLAGRFLITERQIERTAVEGLARAALRGSDDETLISELEVVARREAAVGLGRLATPETKKVDRKQLIVDAETRTLIEEVISYTASRKQLASDWGFENLMPYGLGVTALFSGPPGTGKTLAANAIASALGLELFRVDLSQLVSKFIGETEKHLATLFSAAEQGEVMLLFDEADSLFSKRTEVKSSTDRYANLEVNYLLQRVERFDGVVVLTTNFEAGIDDAFARRIRFRVHFPQPDVDARKRLWRALTPADVPLSDDVDFDALAEDYDLSGGHIKECVLRAASLAMSTESGAMVVTQDLLVRSAEAEYRKLGKLLIGQTDYA